MRDGRQDTFTGKERRIREVIRSSGEVRADAAFRERLKREFVQGTIAEPKALREERTERRFPRWAWALVPAAAVILLFVLFLPSTPAPTWSVLAVRGEGSIDFEGQVLATDEPELVAQALGAAGGRVKLSSEVALDLRLDDRMILGLAEGADVTLPALPESASGDPLVSVVHAGDLMIMTGPGFPGTEMHILTNEGRTEITGTIVSVYKGEGYTCVCVLEGTALIGEDEFQLEEVSAGNLKIMFDDGTAPIVTDIASKHKMELVEFSERNEGAFEQAE